MKSWYINTFWVLLIIVILFCLSFTTSESISNENAAFTFISDDSLKVQVNEVLGTDGNILYYRSKFKTPVCADKVCYEVELNFYWNLLGDFVKYELLPGKPLTKDKHTSFSVDDYQKLSNVLANKYSSLGKLKKEELVMKVGRNDLDAVSGSTVSSLKEQTIQGAIYSCYTLWHIANGIVIDSIRNRTVKQLNKQVLSSIIEMNSQDADYFLINNFTKENFKQYFPEIQFLIIRSTGYFAKNCIEKFPDDLLSTVEVQTFFGAQVDKLEHYAQMALFNKLQNKIISTPLQVALIGNMHNDKWKNSLIISLVCSSLNSIEDATIHQMILKIVDEAIWVNQESLEKISAVAKNRVALKSDMQLMMQNYNNKSKIYLKTSGQADFVPLK